ncbi:MAG TPA: hypothetical protein VMV95_02365 [Bacillota bacterium]|nr:hypothetical protein [Bacillota bacterium]
MKIKIKNLSLDVKRCGGLYRFKGLMFVRRKKARALLFDFGTLSKEAIHSFFVFFPFIAVWLDSKGKIIEIRKIKPFVPFVSMKKSYSKLIEIPINKKYSDIVESLL